MRLRRVRPRGQEIRLEAPVVSGIAPPHDLDAEAYCIERCLNSEDERTDVLEILKATHFYSDANARVYEAIVELSENGVPIGVLSVNQWLSDRERLVEVGGGAYLSRLNNAVPRLAMVREQAERVRLLWRRRKLIATCQRIAGEGYGDVGDMREWIDASEGAVYEVAREDEPSELHHLNDLLKAAFERMQAAAERGDRTTGVSTGYERVDSKTAGLHNGEVIVVAGRPGMGKTSFVLNIAVNVASPTVTPRHGEPECVEPGLGVAVFSLEMPREQIAQHMACSEGRVDLGKMRQGLLQPEDWRRVTEAAAYLSTLPIWVDDTSSIGLMELRAKVRRMQAQLARQASTGSRPRRLGLVIIDYLQLMKGRDGLSSREQEISEISRGLKQLAKELKVPVIALSQLNRTSENRSAKDKRPQLCDLRESGAIEQDADTVWLLYRDEYYNPETDAKGIAELIIAKQRSGPTGKVLLRFSAACTRFDNLAHGDYPETNDD